jgi:uncharacterized protein (TIGR03067 family)
MSIRAVVVIAFCSFISVPDLPSEKPTGDALAMQGSWSWDVAYKQSDAQPLILLERVVIKGNRLTFHYRSGERPGGRFTIENIFKLDQPAIPKRIDFMPLSGANKGKAYEGLYDLQPGQMKICYRGPGSTRPRDFRDKLEGNSSTTFIYLKMDRIREKD